MMKVVIDTNILVAALMSPAGASRSVLRLAFEGEIMPLVGNALFAEYEDLLARDKPFGSCPFDAAKRAAFLDDFLSLCKWVEIHFRWRPNLRDEDDDHVVELALAGHADYVITHNMRDLRSGELLMPELRVIEPGEFLRSRRDGPWRH